MLLASIGPELYLLREAPLEQLRLAAGPLVAEGFRRLRTGEIHAQPGFDGEYGKIALISDSERSALQGQLSFFGLAPVSLRSAAPEQKPALAAAISASTPSREKPGRASHYGLNPLQWEAACSQAPVTAVVAGPGTGKTRTLICRMLTLLDQGAVPASQVTAVTFTNHAALEIRNRLAAELGRSSIRQLTIGTFHAICLSLLKKWKLDAPILEETEATILAQQLCSSLGLKLSPRGLLRRISGIKNGTMMPTELPDGVFPAYLATLERYGVIDYDDILLKTIEQLERGSRKIQRSLTAFTHLLVDEFQDTNPLQYRLLRLWSRSNGSLFCIGDPNQSIYGFRGADAKCFSKLASDYPKLKQITLQDNYRSTPEILSCAQPVVRSTALRAVQPSGRKVRVCQAQSALSEGIFIAHEIIRLMGGIDMLGSHGSRKQHTAQESSLSFSDIAILYRTHRQASQLEYCLKKEGIPYLVLGREEFLSDPAVRQALCFFRLLIQPQNLLALTICLQQAGYDSKSICAQYQACGCDLESLKSMLILCRASSKQGDFAGCDLLALLDHFLPIARQQSAQSLLSDWAQLQNLADNTAFERLLCTAAAQSDLSTFLSNLALGQERDIVRSGSRSYPLDAVTLSTLHGAKGLEFESVFLSGVNQGIIPLQNMGSVDLSEERRLLYVGMTRAKASLTLSFYGQPSPLLSELPQAFFQADDASERRRILAKQLSLFESSPR